MMKNKKLILIIISVVLVIMIGLGIALASKKETVSYELKFDSNGGTVVENQTVKSGDKIKIPEDPIKKGYKFIEWQYKGESFDFSKTIDKNITLVAKWVKVDENSELFVVKFDSDGGSNITNQVIEKGKVAKKPNDPTKDGYKFISWQLDSKDYNFDTKIMKDLTLVAKWEKIEEKTQTTVKPTNTQKPTPKPTPEPPPEPTPEPVVKNYTVSFNSNGGSGVSSQVIASGSKASKPSNPTKTGYNFSGWTLNGSTFNFGTAITGNITLVATWAQKTYTITATPVDTYSPDRILTVKEDGTPISVLSINFIDDVELCSGSNMTVGASDIEGETSFKVVLTDGTEVFATKN